MRELDEQIVQFYRDCGRSQFDVVIEMGSGSIKYIRDAIAHVVLHRSARYRVGGHVEIMIQYPRWLNIVWNVRGMSQIGHHARICMIYSDFSFFIIAYSLFDVDILIIMIVEFGRMIAYEYCGRLTYHYPAKRVKYVSETGRTLSVVNLIYYSNRRHVEVKHDQTSEILYYWYPVLSKGPLMSGIIGEREGGRDIPMPLQKRPDDFPLQLGDQSDATHKTTDFIRQIYVQHWPSLWELYRTQGASTALEQVYQWISSAVATVYPTPIGSVSVMCTPKTDDNVTTLPLPSGRCVSDITASSSSLSVEPDDNNISHAAASTVSYTFIRNVGRCGRIRSSAFRDHTVETKENCHDDDIVDGNELYNSDIEDDDLDYPNPTERRRCHPKRRRRVHEKTDLDDEILVLSSILVEPTSIHGPGSSEVAVKSVLKKKKKISTKKRKHCGDELAASQQDDHNRRGDVTPEANTNGMAMDGAVPYQLHVQDQDNSMLSAKRIKLEDTAIAMYANTLSIPARTEWDNSVGLSCAVTESDHSSSDDPSASSSLSILDALLLSNDWSSCEDDLLFGVVPDAVMHPSSSYHDAFMVDHVPDGAFLPLVHSQSKSDHHNVGTPKWSICTDSMFENDCIRYTNPFDDSLNGSDLLLNDNSNGVYNNSYPSTLSQENEEDHSTECFLN